MRTIGELASAAGVSVRTLHHYDELGLLRPVTRTEAGYRLYNDDDIRRLHEILLWRSLGFPLEEVRALIDDPAHDPLEAMRLHRERLLEELGALTARVEALDVAIARASGSEALTDQDLRALFDGFDPAAYEDEVARRWGQTEEHRESKRRTARYGKREWEQMRAEARELGERLAGLCRAGTPTDSPEARAAAAAHGAHITRWFYTLSPQVHVALARGYVEDPRFAASYEALAPGLSVWLRDAILALHAPPRKTL